MRTNGRAIYNERGEIFRIRGFIQDITDKVLAERKWEEERNLNIQASKMVTLGEMAGGVAHEINNPLMVVSGFSNRLKRKIENSNDLSEIKSSLLEGLLRIKQASDRMGKIVNSLRVFSRDASLDDFESVTALSLVEDAISFVGERYKTKDISIEVDEDSLQDLVSCREIQLCQVVLNLLNNAHDALVEFETSEGKIKVSGKVESNYFWLMVEDNGAGVSDELIDKIMNPFFTTKEVGKGTGLGLSISKSIMADHGGDLLYLNDYPGGCFVMKIPLASASLKSEAS